MSEKISFDEFSPLSKSDWIEQIINDLKLKSFNELNWNLEPGLEMDAFYHDELRSKEVSILQPGKLDWEIMEYLEPANSLEIHDIIEQDICSFMITEPRQIDVFTSATLSGLARLHVLCLSNELSKWEQALSTVHSENLRIASFRVYDNPLFSHSSFDDSFKLDSNYIWISVANDYDIWSDNIAIELCRLCDSLEHLRMTNDPNPVKVITSVSINHDFLKEIIRLRALRILFANIWAAYDYSEETLPEMEANIFAVEKATEYQTSFIHNTTMALSAILGGVDRMMIRPFKTGDQTKDKLIRRVNRNIHHVLKLESLTNKFQDPAAGSYLLDEGTRRLALVTWKKFQNRYQKEK